MRYQSIPTAGALRKSVEPPARHGTRKYQEDSDRLMGLICAPLVFGLAYITTTLILLVLYA